MMAQDQDQELKFEPITEGLGFHPFADGLPYAPRSTTPAAKPRPKAAPLSERPSHPPMGSGAELAGRPQFAPPRARVSVPVASSSAPVAAAAQAVPAPQTAQTAPSPLSELKEIYGFGYLFKRAAAYIVDTILNLSLCLGALNAALWHQNIQADMLLNPGVVLIAGLFLGFFSWALVTAQEVVFGTSIGKRLFGLALRGGTTETFLRAFFFLSSVGFFGVGLIWAIFDRRRRCWHDLMADLQPQEIARL